MSRDPLRMNRLMVGRLMGSRRALSVECFRVHEPGTLSSSGTIPTGYLIWNVTDGAVKRHAGACSWEITVGAGTSAKIGFHGATPGGRTPTRLPRRTSPP